jgi:hypothetical protein
LRSVIPSFVSGVPGLAKPGTFRTFDARWGPKTAAMTVGWDRRKSKLQKEYTSGVADKRKPFISLKTGA